MGLLDRINSLWATSLEREKKRRRFWTTLEWSWKERDRIVRTKPIMCKSYHIAFLDHLAVTMRAWGGNTVAIKDTGGTDRIINPTGSGVGSVSGNAGIDTLGIVVGTGSDAQAMTGAVSYQLKTKIAHGNLATQLNYGATSIAQPATVGWTRFTTVARTFTNNSGSDITVNEVGMYGMEAVGGTGYYFLFERTLSTKTIANAGSATATYTVGITVS